MSVKRFTGEYGKTTVAPPRQSRPAIVAVCVLAILAAVASVVWSSMQTNRPGLTHYNTAMSLLSQGDVSGAQRALYAGTQEDPSYGPCHVQLGVIYSKQGRFADAVAEYKTAARLMPSDGKVWFVLSSAQQTVRDNRGAKDSAEKAAKLLPNDADAQYQFAMALDRLNNPDAAYPLLRKAHELQPSNPEYLLTLAKFGLALPHQLDQLPYQEKELATYLAANPTDADAALFMAQTEERLPPTPDRLQSALKWAQVARSAHPTDPAADLVLGQLDLSSNRPDLAVTAYEAAARLQPKSPDVLHGLLVCYTRTGQNAKADEIQKQLGRIATNTANTPRG